MKKVFSYNTWQVNRIMQKMPYLSLSYSNLMKQFLIIYFGQSPFIPYQFVGGIPPPVSTLIRSQFVSTIRDACYFLKFKPDEDLLKEIYDELRGYRENIQYREFLQFIKRSLV